jgi:hypothetical protein
VITESLFVRIWHSALTVYTSLATVVRALRPRPVSFPVRRILMSKSKLAASLGAVAFVAAIAATGFASPTFAANYSAAANGGGSAGYNHQVATDYRLKHHQTKHHTTQPAKPQ